MEQEMCVTEIASTRIAAVCKESNFNNIGQDIMESLDKVYAFLKENNIRQNGHNVVVYLDQIPNVEIGVQVSDEFEDSSTIKCSSTPSGLVVTRPYFGDYSGLPDMLASIRAWCSENNKKLAGPNWEIYGDWDDNPQNRRTDVYYLLKDS